MFRRLLVYVLMLGTGVVWAQRVLTTPDLSRLTRVDTAILSVDSRTGWIYASAFGTRASGISFAGLARINFAGVPDTFWRPAGMASVESHVVGSNGDVYALIRASGGIAQVVRYSAMRGGEPTIRYTIPPFPTPSGSINRQMRVDRIFGGRDQWLYLSVYDANEASLGQQIVRIDTRTDQFDPQWSYVISERNVSLIEGAGGSVHVVGISNRPVQTTTWVITRVNSGASANILWTSELVATTVFATADAEGRLYVMTRTNNGVATAVVTRLTASGTVDPSWSGAGASQAMSQGTQNIEMRAQGSDLFVTAAPAATESTSSFVIVRVDASGVERARWTKSGVRSPINSPLIAESSSGGLYISAINMLYELDTVTLREKRSIPLTFGAVAEPPQVLQLPDGGHILAGYFAVSYGSRRYQYILRLGADGIPDASWGVQTDALRSFGATLTPRGVVLSGNFTSVNGVAANGVALVSLAPGAAVTPDWGADWSSNGAGSVFDGQAYFYRIVYANPVPAIRRISLANGRFDPDWLIPIVMPNTGESPISVAPDAGGGVWLFSGRDLFGSSRTLTIQRFDVTTQSETLRAAAGPSQSYTRKLVSTAQHAYIGSQRYTLARGGELDSAWNLARMYTGFESPIHAITPSYLYFVDNTTDGVGPILLRRAPLSGNGAADTDWRARSTSGALSERVEFMVKQTAAPLSDDVFYLVSRLDPLNFNRLVNSALVTTRNDVAASNTVIEYFNSAIGRYFMSGRSAEQALLDAMPGTFSRTGMSFVAKSSLYSDGPETPICRFYASPITGGSNTHFYGTGDDCTVLNTVQGLSFEGFDFAAQTPSAAAVCPAESPHAVYRLFNNKAVSNESNHRYVVSVATKAKMTAQGWIDEGAVFCSASVVDAAN